MKPYRVSNENLFNVLQDSIPCFSFIGKVTCTLTTLGTPKIGKKPKLWLV